MSMIRFALLGLVLFLIRASSEWHLTKCFPPGEIFLGNSTKCVSEPKYAIGVSVHYWNITTKLGIPQCKESEDLAASGYDGKITLQMPACIEIRHELTGKNYSIIILHCRSNKDQQVKAIDTSFPQFLHIRKCCVGDTIFDSRTKTCITRLNESQSLGAFLLNRSADSESVVIATHGPPKCKGPIVKYEVNETDIFVRNSKVMVPAFNNSDKEEPITENNACLEMTPDFAFKRRLVIRVCRDLQFCRTDACIRKCCSEDEYYYDGYGCDNLIPNEPREFHNAFANVVNQTNSSNFDTTKDYGVLSRFRCKPPYFINNAKYPDAWEEHVSLSSDGHVFVQNYNVNIMHCFDIVYNKFNNFSQFSLLTCFKYSMDDISYNLWFATLIVNCVFLLMTLLVYAYLPNLQNLHGKTVMCYVIISLLSTILTFIKTWYEVAYEQKNSTICKALALITIFVQLSENLWLNVMCFDIWWTLRILRENKIRKNHKKRFLLYCLYAWGISFLLLILIIVAAETDILPDYLKPKFDNIRCGFIVADDWENFGDIIFLDVPHMILLIFNMVFFILTSKYYNKVKADIKNVIMDPRSKQLHSSRKGFIVNIKLFVVMGIFWIFNIIEVFLYKSTDSHSWVISMFYYISFVYDILEGLLIFIIFVLKKSVYQAIRKRQGL